MGAAATVSNDAHQKAESQWFTPPGVSEPFIDWCGFDDDETLLEPSAGEGALVPRNRPNVIAFEKDPLLIDELKYWRPRATVINYDFLKAEPVPVDGALGNPPYHNDGEATFTYQSLQWAPRACMLMRLVALQGERRFLKCWRFVQVDRLAVLVYRPQFLGPGGRPTDFSPFTAFAAFDCSLRPEPLPLDGYSEWKSQIREFSMVDWR